MLLKIDAAEIQVPRPTSASQSRSIDADTYLRTYIPFLTLSSISIIIRLLETLRTPRLEPLHVRLLPLLLLRRFYRVVSGNSGRLNSKRR